MEFLTMLLIVFIMSSITVLMIAAAKAIIGNRVSPVFHYYIWMILIIRLIFPILPQSNFSVYNIFTEHITVSSRIEAETAVKPEITEPVSEHTADQSKTQSQKQPPQLSESEYSIESIASIPAELWENIPYNGIVIAIYLSVTAALMTMLIIEYFSNKRLLIASSKLCRNEEINRMARDMALSLGIKRDIPVYIGRKSLVYGCFDSFVVLDGDMLDSCEMILAHELTHLKRRDNMMNILIAILRRLYWFNPIVTKGLDMISNDMELICDYRAVNRFMIRKDEYAMLLYKSVKMNDEKEGRLVTSASMSSAGKQLIRRLNFLSRTKKTRIGVMLVSLILLAAIATSCLTNPMIAMEENNSEIYMASFASMAASGGAALPEANDKVTAGGFIDMMITALNSADLPQPACTRLEAIKEGGAEYFIEMLKSDYKEHRAAVNAELIDKIVLEDAVSNEEAAFLMNHMIIYLSRDRVFVKDETGEVDSKLYIPTFVQRDEIEALCQAIIESGQENAENNVKKLNAFLVMKSYDGIPTKNFETGLPLTEEEIEQCKLELQSVYPIVDAMETYVYDPYASRRENNLIASYFKSVKGFNYTDTQSLHGMANYPTLLPHVIGKTNFEKKLISTVTDAALAAEIKAAYTYDDEAEVYILDTSLDSALLVNLGSRLARNSAYTYEQMHTDHALNGFSYLETNGLTLEDIYPSPEELPANFRDEENYIVEGSKYVLEIMTISSFEKLIDALDDEKEIKKLRAYYMRVDLNDPRLNMPEAYINLTAQFGEFGEDGVCIFDPYAADMEIEMIDNIIENALNSDSRTGLYCMPIRAYIEYTDESAINEYALNSVKELARFGIVKNGGRFNPAGALKYSVAAEMVTKLISGLIAY